MRLFSSILTAASVVGLLSACGQSAPQTGQGASAAASSAPDYEISKNGIVKEENKHSYDSLGDTTFIRTQAYKVRRVTKGKQEESRLLFLKYVVKIGDKDASDGMAPIVIDKGEGELLCSSSYDVKTANYDTTPDPKCTYTVLGDSPLTPVNVVFK
jgi:uncharacterized lipoprotein YehR (DUF1307 family)